MHWDQIEGHWKTVKGRFRQKWGKLTGSDLDQAAGIRDRLAGLLQQRYGLAKDRAEERLDEFVRSLESPDEDEEPRVEESEHAPRPRPSRGES